MSADGTQVTAEEPRPEAKIRSANSVDTSCELKGDSLYRRCNCDYRKSVLAKVFDKRKRTQYASRESGDIVDCVKYVRECIAEEDDLANN